MVEKPLTAIKTNKQAKKKRKEKNRYNKKKLEELGVVMVGILTEAFKLLHLQVPNIANIKWHPQFQLIRVTNASWKLHDFSAMTAVPL